MAIQRNMHSANVPQPAPPASPPEGSRRPGVSEIHDTAGDRLALLLQMAGPHMGQPPVPAVFRALELGIGIYQQIHAVSDRADSAGRGLAVHAARAKERVVLPVVAAGFGVAAEMDSMRASADAKIDREFRERAIEIADSELREASDRLVSEWVDAIRDAQRAVESETAKQTGPAALRIPVNLDTLSRSELLREDLEQRQADELLTMFAGYVERGEHETAELFALAASKIAAHRLNRAKLKDLTAFLTPPAAEGPRAGALERERSACAELQLAIGAYRASRVTPALTYARAALTALETVFLDLVGRSHRFMGRAEFARTYLADSGKTRDPFAEIDPNWTTRNLRPLPR